MLESEDVEWAPLMSFWIDTEAYTDRDRQMFVCGVEFEMLYAAIRDGRGWCQCIHTENESRVRMMCGKLKVPCELERVDETWSHCEIPPGSKGEA